MTEHGESRQIITTTELTKRYGRVLAVDRVSLEVNEGDRYGLLGPNGSGKTTLIRLLLGLVFATSGRAALLGHPVPRQVAKALPDVGVLVEGPAGYGHLSGRANLRLLDAAGPGGTRDGRQSRPRRIEQTLERVGLAGIDDRPVKAYSLGMRQRLGLAAALLRPPKLLVLDEPTNGLDPVGIRDVRDLLRELNEAGTTLVLSSHLLGEIEQLCTRVAVMDAGALVLQEEMATVRRPTGRVVVSSPDADLAVGLLDGRVEERTADRLVIRHSDPAELNTLLVTAGLRVTAIDAQRRSLEEVVLAATGTGSDRVDRVDRTDRVDRADRADPIDLGQMTGDEPWQVS